MWSGLYLQGSFNNLSVQYNNKIWSVHLKDDSDLPISILCTSENDFNAIDKNICPGASLQFS